MLGENRAKCTGVAATEIVDKLLIRNLVDCCVVGMDAVVCVVFVVALLSVAGVRGLRHDPPIVVALQVCPPCVPHYTADTTTAPPGIAQNTVQQRPDGAEVFCYRGFYRWSFDR